MTDFSRPDRVPEVEKFAFQFTIPSKLNIGELKTRISYRRLVLEAIFWLKGWFLFPLQCMPFFVLNSYGLFHYWIFNTLAGLYDLFFYFCSLIWCFISEWEPYSVILRCLCQLDPLQMILYLHFSRFFGLCWRNFLCLDTWKMLIYPQQLAGLFLKQFNLQVALKTSNCGFEMSWDLLPTQYLIVMWFHFMCRPAIFDGTAQSTWLPINKFFVIRKSWMLRQNG